MAVFIGFALAFAFFILSLVRLLGSYHEQKTAIEAAAFAVARDLSAIVVDDPYFGYVGLADQPPNGTATIAGDNYFLSVQGINTIFATIRLDMIIADRLDSPVMKQCAQRDYLLALAAQERLQAQLQRALSPTGFAQDSNGRRIEPYKDAVAAYNSNRVRMSGGTSVLVPNSMKLSLGWETGLTTNMQVPQPASIASVASSAQETGNYVPFVNIPYKDTNFVFTAGSDNILLVDNNKFQTSPPNLPFCVLDIVRCEADQQSTIKENHNDNKLVTTHCSACAEPATTIDPLPDSGALQLSFPNGMPPEIGKLGDILLYQGLINSPADLVQTVSGGDSPPHALTPYVLPIINDPHPEFGKIISLAFYDWLRRGRSHIDVGSLIGTLNSPLDRSGSSGLSQNFQVQPSGTVTCKIQPDVATQDLVVSDNQYWAVTGLAINSSNGHIYDVFLRDFVFQPGKTKGGLHAGEPLDTSGALIPAASTYQTLNEHPAFTRAFSVGHAPGQVRLTYDNMGTAVQIRFKAR